MTTTSTETDWRTRYTDCARCGIQIQRNHSRRNQFCADCRYSDPDLCRTLGGDQPLPPPVNPADIDHGLNGYNNHRCRCDTCKAAKAASRPVVHGANRYDKHGCRCDVCTEANRERGRKRRAQQGAKPRPKQDHVHGQFAMYQAGCRCDPCRAANAAYRREQRGRRREQGPDTWHHGRYATYSMYACRCAPCAQAAVDYRQRAAKRAKEAA